VSRKIAAIVEYPSGLTGNRLGATGVTLRVLPDSNIYDKFIDLPCIRNRILELIQRDRIELLQPHIIRSQLAATPDISRREALLSIPAKTVPVDGMLAGYSCAGDRVGDGSGGLKTDVMLKDKKPTPGHTRDALIATTAATEADVLVTEDRQLGNKIKSMKPTIQVWNFADFESHLANL
jgi:hypothetical protein